MAVKWHRTRFVFHLVGINHVFPFPGLTGKRSDSFSCAINIHDFAFVATRRATKRSGHPDGSTWRPRIGLCQKRIVHVRLAFTVPVQSLTYKGQVCVVSHVHTAHRVYLYHITRLLFPYLSPFYFTVHSLPNELILNKN